MNARGRALLSSAAGKSALAAATKAATSRATQQAVQQAALRAATQQATSRAVSQASSVALSKLSSATLQRAAARATNLLSKGIPLSERGKEVLSAANFSKLDDFTKNRLAVLDAQAKDEMQQDPEFREAYPEISTFFSNLGRYDLDTQQKILSQIQSEANAQVDGAFDSEVDFINRLKAIKKGAITDKLNTFKEQEKQSLDKILGEVSRDAGDAGTQYFAQLASSNALDTGMLGSFGDRILEELTRKQQQEKDASALAIKQAEDAANSDNSLADMSAEEALFIGENSIFARREAARAERYADLLGLNADQDLLLQTPTALNTTLTPTRSTKAAEPSSYITPRVSSGASLRSPTPATVSASQSRAVTRAKSLADRYGASSLNTRGRSLIGLY